MYKKNKGDKENIDRNAAFYRKNKCLWKRDKRPESFLKGTDRG